MNLLIGLQWTMVALLTCLVGGTLVNLSRHPHWFIRGWDFPRLQIVLLAILILAIYLVCGWQLGNLWRTIDIAIVVTASSLIALHTFRIFAYTPLAPRQVLRTRRPDDRRTIRVVVSNVEMENEQHSLWLKTVRQADPDVVIAIETNQRWVDQVSGHFSDYPYQVLQPQENWYGMSLFSRLPLESSEVRFLVQSDIPSIHVHARMSCGQVIRICGVHPRPPEPLRNNSSSHRDAELVLLAEELQEASLSAIVAGDLNDVAWSATTRLFLKRSSLLDPRRGRGFFNSFHAAHWWFRFPLDHVFHSREFSLRRVQRLGYVGSDHFPILAELQYDPVHQHEQAPLESEDEDEDFRDEIIQRELQTDGSEIPSEIAEEFKPNEK